MTTLRCAIYTRKSSEEGLEQGFNSLHAQREACEAYVLSQAGEGWKAIPTEYDDGGFSGGNMERPAMRQLLVDIDRGLIDIVVVYKVDRLTRSLSDFSKIVDRFDAKSVSFVSVMILEGLQPRAMTLQLLTAKPLPRAWADQRRLVASFD
jgi:site-specific DNA recombinase